MIRKIVDYKKLNHELANLLIESFPHGYGDEDIIIFKNAKGDYVEAVEIKTDDYLYLVKISKSLAIFIENFDDTIAKELEKTTKSLLEEAGASEIEQELNNEADLEEGESF